MVGKFCEVLIWQLFWRLEKITKLNSANIKKIGRFGTKNSPVKVARHFPQLLDGKLP